MATSKMAMTTRAESASEMENLPSLFGRLGDDIMQLFDTKFNLLKVEVRDDVTAYFKATMTMALGAMVAVIGFALANVALALGISTLFQNANLSQAGRYGLGFAITGFLYLVVGGIVALAMKRRLASQNLVPDRTIRELRKDSEWLKKEL
jgi:uncharacterized membrane protein YqjE